MSEILAPKRKTITKLEAAERARKLNEFLKKADVKKQVQECKEHKRASFIRTKFAEETGCSIPVSSIYKLLRPTSATPAPAEEPKKKTKAAKKTAKDDDQIDAVPIDL